MVKITIFLRDTALALSIRPKISKFSKRGQMVRQYFQGKVPENPEIFQFPKSEPLNRKFWTFRDENQMERKFPGQNVRKFEYVSRDCPLFWEIMQIRNFLFSASSFDRDHSKLVISSKDDGDAINTSYS